MKAAPRRTLACRPLAAAAALALSCAPVPELPRLGRLPDFALTGVTAKARRPLTSRDLAGGPWVADFIFTTCAGPCPLLSANMAGLQARLPPEVSFVSFSVDPAHDTPEVLTAYAQKLGADPQRWLFATGPRKALADLLEGGFRLPLAEDARAPAGRRISHSARFVLVDRGLEVRGYYDGTDLAELRRLVRDARSLLKPS